MKWSSWPHAQRCACYFPQGMAMRHRASSPMLPSYSHLIASLLFFSLLALRLLCFFPGIGLFPGMVVLSLLRMAVLTLRRYGSIDVPLATQLLSNPQLVGTAPSTGRPGWSNKGYPRGRHTRALVKALADSLLGFWPRLSRELLFGLGSTWLGSAPNTWFLSLHQSAC